MASFLYLEGMLPSCGKVIDTPDCSLRKMKLEGGAMTGIELVTYALRGLGTALLHHQFHVL